MINVHILHSNCPPPAATHAQSLFCHSPSDEKIIAKIQRGPDFMKHGVVVLVTSPQSNLRRAHRIVRLKINPRPASHYVYVDAKR